MPEIRSLYEKSKSGESVVIYPITSTEAVYTSEGETIDAVVQEAVDNTSAAKTAVQTIQLNGTTLAKSSAGVVNIDNIYTKTQTNETFLPLAGGTLAGNLYMGDGESANSKAIHFQDSTGRHLWMGTANSTGDLYLYDTVGGRYVFKSAADENFSRFKGIADRNISLDWNGYTAITSGSNLNNYTNIGNYYAASSTVTNYPLGATEAVSFRMIIWHNAETGSIWQTIYENEGNIIWQRYYYSSSSSWSGWMLVAGKKNVSSYFSFTDNDYLALGGAIKQKIFLGAGNTLSGIIQVSPVQNISASKHYFMEYSFSGKSTLDGTGVLYAQGTPLLATSSSTQGSTAYFGNLFLDSSRLHLMLFGDGWATTYTGTFCVNGLIY